MSPSRRCSNSVSYAASAGSTVSRSPIAPRIDRIVSNDGTAVLAMHPGMAALLVLAECLVDPGRLTPLRRARSEMPCERATVARALRSSSGVASSR